VRDNGLIDILHSDALHHRNKKFEAKSTHWRWTLYRNIHAQVNGWIFIGVQGGIGKRQVATANNDAMLGGYIDPSSSPKTDTRNFCAGDLHRRCIPFRSIGPIQA
jgi:3-keto-L-gulonate-6-phosphate decarboxylase